MSWRTTLFVCMTLVLMAGALVEWSVASLEVRRFSHHQPRHETRGVPLPASAQEAPIPYPPQILGHAGGESHDPELLLARANRLAEAGLELEIDTAEVSVGGSFGSLATEMAAGTRLVPATFAGESIGVRVVSLLPVFPLDSIGLREGDIITAVNGRGLASVDRALEPYDGLHPSRLLIVELVRARHRVILALTLV